MRLPIRPCLTLFAVRRPQGRVSVHGLDSTALRWLGVREYSESPEEAGRPHKTRPATVASWF